MDESHSDDVSDGCDPDSGDESALKHDEEAELQKAEENDAAIFASKEKIRNVEQALTHGKFRPKRPSGGSTKKSSDSARYILFGLRVPASSKDRQKAPAVKGRASDSSTGSQLLDIQQIVPQPRSYSAGEKSFPEHLRNMRVRSREGIVALQTAVHTALEPPASPGTTTLSSASASPAASPRPSMLGRQLAVKEAKTGGIDIGRQNTIMRRTNAIKAVESELRRPSSDPTLMRGSIHRESIVEVERMLKKEGKSDPDNSDAEIERRHSDYILGIRDRPKLSSSALVELVQDTKSKLLQQVQGSHEIEAQTLESIRLYFEYFGNAHSATISADDVRAHMSSFSPPFTKEELLILWGETIPNDELTMENFTDLCLLHGLESIPSLADTHRPTRGVTMRRRQAAPTMTRHLSEPEFLAANFPLHDPVESSV